MLAGFCRCVQDLLAQEGARAVPSAGQTLRRHGIAGRMIAQDYWVRHFIVLNCRVPCNSHDPFNIGIPDHVSPTLRGLACLASSFARSWSIIRQAPSPCSHTTSTISLLHSTHSCSSPPVPEAEWVQLVGDKVCFKYHGSWQKSEKPQQTSHGNILHQSQLKPHDRQYAV